MKRYWRLIAIAVVIVLSISTFYVQSALSAGNNPEFIFKKVSGNPSELEPVVLFGNYQAVVNGAGESIRLTNEGAEYSSELSLFERLKHMYSPEVSSLIDKYRGFMRGKGGSLSSYYEGENAVAYANVSNQFINGTTSELEFTVEVLNKKTDQVTEFIVPVPNRAMYHQIYVEDVQMINGQLKIVTQNFLRNAGNQSSIANQETHIYTFDIGKQKLIDGETVLSADDSDTDYYTHMNVVNAEDISGHEVIVFQKTQEGLKPGAEGKRDQTERPEPEVELIAYDLKKDEKMEIKIPEEHQSKVPMASNGSLLYLMERSESQGEIAVYDMEKERVKNTFTIPTPSLQENAPLDIQSIVRIQDGKVYVFTSQYGKALTKGSSSFHVIEGSSGKTLYHGYIKSKKPLNEDAFLHMYSMDLKK
ncbi:hypothetical protein ACFO3D_15010 [Virgibacillus kekensis]|uniref:HlyD family secretion protein n=1 Tax=Virgibacillus kekensis TaxID=202261 RepID=A0ABV9DKX7_9BACI